MAFTYAIALTGGIATGKSTASKMLVDLGFFLIDADVVAHKMLDEQAFNVAKIFGDSILKDGKIDRKTLGSIVFSQASKREELEALLHPLIYDEIARLSCVQDELAKPYLIDIPLFFETNRYPIEKSIVVYAPKTLQQTRLMARNTLSEDEAKNRIDTQMDIEKKVKLASYVIDNSATLQDLEKECKRIKKEILNDGD